MSTAVNGSSAPSPSGLSSPKPGVVGSKLRGSYTWRQYTIEEVSNHNHTSEALWLIIHGKVYDVAAFLEDHPGGPEILQQHGGRDATQDFEETFHSPAAREQLKDYVIGGVVGYTGPEDAHLGNKKSSTNKTTANGNKGNSASKIPAVYLAVALVAVGAVLLGYYLTVIQK